ncbi:hypothetical protein BCR39DRAFT_374397 [Naematelia encephala]|uniref:Uncharacterized protein n=1 Tax=Naematelia encephala TaxID=71784 RepID=A0A1Y2BD81_9TREE|nr:hypothetical protein BCR39DRAFT_374397 [Naematelia encephala]
MDLHNVGLKPAGILYLTFASIYISLTLIDCYLSLPFTASSFYLSLRRYLFLSFNGISHSFICFSHLPSIYSCRHIVVLNPSSTHAVSSTNSIHTESL